MNKILKFTLIELLIVIAMIAILVSILLPGLSKARTAAKMAVCLSNLKQNGTSLYLYTKSNNHYYPQMKGGYDRWQVRRVGKFERRPLLQKVYQNEGTLKCPLAPSNGSFYESDAFRIYINYEFYAGTYLDVTAPQSSMLNEIKPTIYGGEEFSVLMGDQLRTDSADRFIVSHPDSGLRKGATNNSDYFISAYSGYSLNNLSRNFVFKAGNAKTIKGIRAASTDIVDARFKSVSGFTFHNNSGARSWAPFDE